MALHCAAAGWRLALVARRTAETQAWLHSQGVRPEQAVVYGADVAVPDSIVQAGHACIEQQGLPDLVLACAGVSVGMDTAERADIDVMRDTFALNNVGLAATFHPFLAGMRQRRSGTLVGIASVSAIRGLPGHGAYCASKAGVVAYCESLRGECLADGVRVVTLLPGYIATPLTAGNPYSMPFLLTADVFAARAFRAINAGRSYAVIPWQMAIVAKLLRMLPNALFDLLLARRARKPRRA